MSALLLLSALSGAVPVSFVTVESLLIVAAALAAVGAALTGVLAYRARRDRAAARRDPPRRRAPSPSSLGMADDPIVAAIEAGARDRARRRRAHHADRIEP